MGHYWVEGSRMEQVTGLNFLDNEGAGYPFLSAQYAWVGKDMKRRSFMSLELVAIPLGRTQIQIDLICHLSLPS